MTDATIVSAEELKPFLEKVLADPDNDAPRLELANFLLRRGDMRGLHIQLSCELAHLDREDPARAQLEERLKKLPNVVFVGCPSPNIPLQYGIERGFVERLDCTIWHFIEHADAFFAWAPIRAYYPLHAGGSGWFQALANFPALAKLRRLDLQNVFKAEELRTLFVSPHLTQLREVQLHRALETPADVAELADLLEPLTGLRVLLISGFYNRAARDAFVRFVKDRRFERVYLFGAGGNALTVDELYAELGDVLADPRPDYPVKFRFGVLELSWQKFDAKNFPALLASREYRSAKQLIIRVRIGNDGLEQLARSGAFPELVELNLGGTGLTDAGAYALAEHAVGLDKLETISLGDVPREASNIGAMDEFGISDDGVRALALSPRLPALHTITRSKEYRNSFDGREGREVIPITRPDGRVVESIIYHSIWP